jgi:hypothetical protein
MDMAKKTFFFYLNDKVEVEAETLTGMQIKQAIKAEVPDFDLGHELVLEGHGPDPDRQIGDSESVDLSHSHGGPKRFFARAPTNFGA